MTYTPNASARSEPFYELRDERAAHAGHFADVVRRLHEGRAEHVFPGAALAVVLHDRLMLLHGSGRFTYDAKSEGISGWTVWDLASLTKPIAAVSMAMLLYERGRLPLEAKVAELLPEFAAGDDPRRREVTVRMLLEHSSGLPAHRKLYLEHTGREAVTSAALRVPLEYEPGTHYEYSDIGFLVLGEILERQAGERIDAFCQREVFDRFKLNFRYTPHPRMNIQFPPTANDETWRHRMVQGEVGDENASAMGGVAAHAGVFGDALSVARFGALMLRGGEPLFRPETVRLFTTRASAPEGTSRTPGWDTPSAPSQSGTRFSPRSFGHLGYTGTSLWCDPERGLVVALLTNRTWPDTANQAIKQFRPALHDLIAEAVERVKS
ncbi:MAG: serine hydrolase [Acidobacteriota bacterium]|nr:serine hydrolase [Acidobacteriota bacterium]